MTLYHRQQSEDLTRRLDQSITKAEPVKVVRSIIGGQSPDGPFTNLPASGQHTLNSSTVPLAALEFSSGTYLDISQYAGAAVSVNADADGTLLVDHSINGVDADFSESFSVSSGSAFFLGVIPFARFVKISYQNGDVAQGKFRLSTIAKINPINPQFEPLNATVTDASVAQLSRNAILGKDVLTGQYEAVNTESGRLQVVIPPPAAPPGTEIASATITGLQASGATDSTYVIQAGSTLTFQAISGGSEVTSAGGKTELFWDIDCDDATPATPETFIEVIYSNGSSTSFALSDEFVGDGDDCVRLRRTNLTGGNIDMFSRWRGYLQSSGRGL